MESVEHEAIIEEATEALEDLGNSVAGTMSDSADLYEEDGEFTLQFYWFVFEDDHDDEGQSFMLSLFKRFEDNGFQFQLWSPNDSLMINRHYDTLDFGDLQDEIQQKVDIFFGEDEWESY